MYNYQIKLPTLPTLLLLYKMPLYSPEESGYARSSALYDIFRFVASSAALLHISHFTHLYKAQVRICTVQYLIKKTGPASSLLPRAQYPTTGTSILRYIQERIKDQDH